MAIIVFMYRQLQFQKQLILLSIRHILNLHSWQKSKNQKLLQWKLKHRRRRQYLPSFRRNQPPRNQGNIEEVDIRARTGLEREEFEDVWDHVKDQIEQPRESTTNRIISTSLSPRFRLLLVLHWLREYPHYKTLEEIYQISIPQISREITHIIPILRAHFPSTIEWPQVWRTVHCCGGMNISGAIDCTSHFRNRVHPFSGDW